MGENRGVIGGAQQLEFLSKMTRSWSASSIASQILPPRATHSSHSFVERFANSVAMAVAAFAMATMVSVRSIGTAVNTWHEKIRSS